MQRLSHELWSNDDAHKNAVAASVMNGEHASLTDGIVNLGFEYNTHFLTTPLRGEGARKVAAALS